MAFTAQLGTADSYLANVELGFVAAMTGAVDAPRRFFFLVGAAHTAFDLQGGVSY